MLLSPGHSPRHLSTPSPSPSLSSDTNPNPNSTIVSASTPDFASRKRRRSPAVLDEDTYVASIEKIIERDFFPDIPKLRDRLDWLQAVRSRDPVLIRDAQLKILERRRIRKGGDSTAAASTDSRRHTTVTPGSSFLRNSSITPSLYNVQKSNLASDELDGNGDGGDELVDVSVSLDEFFRKYTSEDNESFSRIIEKVNRKKKEKYGFLLDCGENSNSGLLENGSNREKNATDGYGTSDQPVSTLEGWKYTAKNLLMYHPADNGEAPLTDEDIALRLKMMTKEISKSNTRFHGKAMDTNTLINIAPDPLPLSLGFVILIATTVAPPPPLPPTRQFAICRRSTTKSTLLQSTSRRVRSHLETLSFLGARSFYPPIDLTTKSNTPRIINRIEAEGLKPLSGAQITGKIRFFACCIKI